MEIIKEYGKRDTEKIKVMITNLVATKEYTQKQRELANKYHIYLSNKGVSLNTIKNYLSNLKTLFLYMKKLPDKWTEKDRDQYLQYIRKEYGSSSVVQKTNIFVYFLEWYYKKPQAEIDLIKELKIKSAKRDTLPSILTPKEVKKMVQVAQNIRDKAVIMLLYETGARRGEFLRLKIKHIELAESNKKKFGFVTIPKGKTSTRRVPMIYSLPHMIDWLNSHPDRDNPEAPLFLNLFTHKGKALGDDALKRIVRTNGERAGLKKRVYPHLFRHSRATELAKEITEQELKKFGGWSANSHATTLYIHLSGEDVSNHILANAGLIDAEKAQKTLVLKSIECPTCHKINSSETKICSCGRILDLKEAQAEIDRYKTYEERLKRVEQLILKTGVTELNTKTASA